jgi:hypothetical protein
MIPFDTLMTRANVLEMTLVWKLKLDFDVGEPTELCFWGDWKIIPNATWKGITDALDIGAPCDCKLCQWRVLHPKVARGMLRFPDNPNRIKWAVQHSRPLYF